ncbi:type II 3-dehydroquinate dehydratase [Eubacterium pyruvativorans]|uniref:type II 3-dehydroquinate dehydratase n=1 Tax=Eubacterium pyruvativorans TaxID=155865 RepID=UPI0013D5202C|nr:type II 3-dehydroquinate dehydratase [Eubacterium pyruvativorans]
MKILVINGPNINMLGIREPDIYGKEDFAELLRRTKKAGEELGLETEFYQSNHEGDLVDRIQEAYGNMDGIVINPGAYTQGAYTHTSVAILDAVKAVGIPTVEVHISDVSRREDFRQTSYIRKAAIATVMGKGIDGYGEALKILKDYLEMMK